MQPNNNRNNIMNKYESNESHTNPSTPFNIIRTIPPKLIIATLFIVTILISIVISSIKNSAPQITKISPQPQSTNTQLNQNIEITFNKPINPKDILIRSNPDENFTISQKSPKTIIASHKLPFYQNTKYDIYIYFKDKLLTKLTFNTVQSQNEPRAIQEINNQTKKDFPAIEYMPYKTKNLTAYYSSPLTITVQIKTKTYTEQKAINELKKWLKSLGIDPQTHNFKIKHTPSSI